MPGRSNNSANRDDDQKFTGHFFEQEGDLEIYHAQARMYDPATGRFWGVDAMRSEMPSWNGYHYTFNNPVRYVDPDGNRPECPECSREQYEAVRGAFYNERLADIKAALYMFKVEALEFFGSVGPLNASFDTQGNTSVSISLDSDLSTTTIDQNGNISETYSLGKSSNIRLGEGGIEAANISVPTNYVNVDFGVDTTSGKGSVGISRGIAKAFRVGVKAIINYRENINEGNRIINESRENTSQVFQENF